MKNTEHCLARLFATRRLLLCLVVLTSILAPEKGLAAASSTPAVTDLTHLTAPHALDGVWRMHFGDDPSFARPDYDDHQWISFDPQTSMHDLTKEQKSGVIWYRQLVHVDPQKRGLALREQTLSKAFDIYINGELLMRSGSVLPYSPYTMQANLLRPIPDREMATGTFLIAVRLYIDSPDWADSNPGLFATNLTLGDAVSLYNEDWLNLIGDNFVSIFDSSLEAALGIIALVLFLSQRRHLEYLWIACLGILQILQLPIRILYLFENIPIGWRFFNASLTIVNPFLEALLYFAFVGKKIGWRMRIFLTIAGLLNAYNILGNQHLVPMPPESYGLLVNVPFVILLSLIIPGVLAIHWRRGNREAGILLIPAMFFSLFIYVNYSLAFLYRVPAWKDAAVQGLNMIQRYPAGPFQISLDNISGILSTTTLAIIMVLRSSRTSRRQALLEGELEAARQVQQVILPEQVESIGDFAIESVYQPAQQVGGDFFQILPVSDGGLLLVFGDVAGKGLPAAMLVSMLAGAVRTVVNFTEAPVAILASLNERLVGRSGGAFSTALAAHFSRDGWVTIANAGHLNPYVDGDERELPGALPLGILSGATYEATQFQLAPGSRMTFYSDGVIEAQNQQGELFGFQRGQDISTQSAAQIVDAAKVFGQSDDITVVAITRGISARAATAA